VIEIGGLQEMQGDEVDAMCGEAEEEVVVGGEGQAREVDFEEFGVTLAIGRRMEDGVGVVEDVFGREPGGC